MSAQDQEKEEATLLDRWNYSGLPSVAAFNHAVDVANANHAALLSLQDENKRLQQELDGWRERFGLKTSIGWQTAEEAKQLADDTWKASGDVSRQWKARSQAAEAALSALRDEFEAYKAEHHDCVQKTMDDAVAVHDEIEARRDGIEAELKRLKTQLGAVTRIEQEMREALQKIYRYGVDPDEYTDAVKHLKHIARDALQQVTRA